MNDEWIWFWFRCFKLNRDYKRYCLAKREQDTKTIAQLERRFKKVAEVYDDWGDIHAFNEWAAHRKYWHEWLEEHRHLFICEDKRKAVVVRTPPKELDDKYLYLKVPIRQSAAIATKEAKALIKKEYTKAKIKSAAKAGVVKYPVAVKNVCDRTLLGVRKALNVWLLYNPASGDKITAKEVAFLLAEGIRNSTHKGIKEWRWTPEDIAKDGNVDDVRTQVMRYNRNANLIIANTIRGEFPKK